jgi:hypothetical protein
MAQEIDKIGRRFVVGFSCSLGGSTSNAGAAASTWRAATARQPMAHRFMKQ